jgi:hypothetical protein
MNPGVTPIPIVLQMTRLRRFAIMTLIIFVAAGAYAAWYVYGAWPVPEGYEFPRHSLWGGGPGALFVGTLMDEDGCILTDAGGTVVWPPGSWLSVTDGEPIVHVSGREVRMGERIPLGGGEYPRAGLAAVAPGAARTRCPEPFFLTTGIAD